MYIEDKMSRKLYKFKTLKDFYDSNGSSNV